MIKNIAVDFNGPICGEYDEPVMGAVDSIARLINMGYKVTIFSSNNPIYIQQWLQKNSSVLFALFMAKKLTVTDRKPIAIAYIDDKAVKFTSWGEMMVLFPASQLYENDNTIRE